jgi:hypothetical protein
MNENNRSPSPNTHPQTKKGLVKLNEVVHTSPSDEKKIKTSKLPNPLFSEGKREKRTSPLVSFSPSGGEKLCSFLWSHDMKVVVNKHSIENSSNPRNRFFFNDGKTCSSFGLRRGYGVAVITSRMIQRTVMHSDRTD